MIKIFEKFFSSIILLLLFPILLIIYMLCLIETKSPIFTQIRLGKDKKRFKLYKFRTMNLNTPSMPSHLVESNSITKIGYFLRKYKMDELPQLFNILIGNMSFVGPRPCLPDQNELIKEREKYKIFSVLPGVTGLAQLRKIDMSDPILLVENELEMINTMTVFKYLKYISLTFLGEGRGDPAKKH